MENKTILVAVDFGSSSDRALDFAVDLARKLAAPLDLVHVCPSVPFGKTPAEMPYVASAYEQLGALAARAAAAGVVTRTDVRCDGVLFGLRDAVEELDPQLVVVGSHGRQGVMRFLLGSVSESLARCLAVPVLIVPASERVELAGSIAWSCRECGHILGDDESPESCARCGDSPARWISASISHEPADVGEPSVGEGAGVGVAPPTVDDGPSMIATAPAGYDRSTPNAEIRIRRF